MKSLDPTSDSDPLSEIDIYNDDFTDFVTKSLDELVDDSVKKVCEDPRNMYFDYRVMTCDVACPRKGENVIQNANCVYSVRTRQ